MTEIVDSNFYSLFNSYYGKPSNILIIKNRKKISEETFDDPDFKQTIIQSTFDLVEGTIDENPLYVIWKKGNYEVKLFYRREQNVTQVIFSSLSSS